MTRDEFRPIPEYPCYSINVKGEIKRHAQNIRTEHGIVRIYPERKVCHQKHPSGMAVHLRSHNGIVKWVGIAPILLELFGPNPKPKNGGPWRCAHKDGDKWSLDLSNLEWMTFGEIKKLNNEKKINCAKEPNLI